MEVSAWNITNFFSNSSSPNFTVFSSSFSSSLLLWSMFMGLPGNMLVVWTILFRLQRRSVTTLLILQLAGADILVLLIAPFYLRQIFLGGVWEFGLVACKLLHYISAVNMYVSVYLVTLMSLDRHMGVVRPLLSQRVRTKSRLRPTVAAVWVLALVLAIPPPVYRQVRNRVCVMYHPSLAHQVFQYSLETVAGFLVPFCIMAVCYIQIARKLASGRARWRHRPYKKTNLLISLIVVTFALLWTPYQLVNILHVGAISSGSFPGLLRFCLKARPVVITLAYLSSAVNPLLYALAGSSFTSFTPGWGRLTRLASNPYTSSNRAEHDGIGGEQDACGGSRRSAAGAEMTQATGRREGEGDDRESGLRVNE